MILPKDDQVDEFFLWIFLSWAFSHLDDLSYDLLRREALTLNIALLVSFFILIFWGHPEVSCLDFSNSFNLSLRRLKLGKGLVVLPLDQGLQLIFVDGESEFPRFPVLKYGCEIASIWIEQHQRQSFVKELANHRGEASNFLKSDVLKLLEQILILFWNAVTIFN